MSLFIDLYELTMAQVYWRKRMFAPATFSLFIREYPYQRGQLVCDGTQEVLAYLAAVRFSGDLFGMPEGQIFYQDEPVPEVDGPLIKAQLAESATVPKWRSCRTGWERSGIQPSIR